MSHAKVQSEPLLRQDIIYTSNLYLAVSHSYILVGFPVLAVSHSNILVGFPDHDYGQTRIFIVDSFPIPRRHHQLGVACSNPGPTLAGYVDWT